MWIEVTAWFVCVCVSVCFKCWVAWLCVDGLYKVWKVLKSYVSTEEPFPGLESVLKKEPGLKKWDFQKW